MQEAKHFDNDKVALQYVLGMTGIDDVARVGMFGAQKYGQYNWRGGMPWMKLCGSLTRHLAAFIRGEDIDPESGLLHLAHLCYDALMLMEYKQDYGHLDDRYQVVEYRAQHQEDNSDIPY